MTQTTRAWLHGLVAAGVGSAAGSFAPIAIDPAKFNLYSLSGAGHVLMCAVVTGFLAVMAYLAKSPLPPPQVLGPGDKASIQNPQIAPDGTITGDSATLQKASMPTDASH